MWPRVLMPINFFCEVANCLNIIFSPPNMQFGKLPTYSPHKSITRVYSQFTKYTIETVRHLYQKENEGKGNQSCNEQCYQSMAVRAFVTAANVALPSQSKSNEFASSRASRAPARMSCAAVVVGPADFNSSAATWKQTSGRADDSAAKQCTSPAQAGVS